MKRTSLRFFVRLLPILAAVAAAQESAVDSARIYNAENYRREFVPGELIVAFKPGARDFSDGGLAARAHVRGRRDLALAKKRGGQAILSQKLALLASGDGTREATLANLEKLRRDPNVAYVEPNYVLHTVAAPNDSSFSLLWGLQNTGQLGGTPHADIDATGAWNRTQGNPNLLIGIIDTGIDYLHPDLADNIWTNPGEIPGNGVDDDGNGFVDDVHGFNFVKNNGDPMDDNGHGTHCAGTIAAVGNNGRGVSGVVWRGKLVALKFLDSAGNGTTAAAINAIAYANAMGISVTNNSWAGSGFSQSLKNVIDAAGNKGYLFIAAAGNGVNNNGVPNNDDVTPQYPASYASANIISVAATDVNDALAGFSNYGAASVDLGAPGVSIYSTKPGRAYQYLSGTSMAAPHVTGAAALIWGYNPALTSAQVKSYLMQGVDPIASLSGKTVTGGRLNVKKALDLALPPDIAYKSAAISAVKGVAIVPDTVISLGGAITAYAMAASTPLPAGLTLNATNGIISGIPSGVVQMTDTVLATGPNGVGWTTVSITVNDTAPAFAYQRPAVTGVKNVAILPDTVRVTGTGAITGYALSGGSALPAGLSLNPSTGVISGVPTAVTILSDTIVATGPGGTGKAVVTLAISDTAPAIAYRRDTLALIRNAAMTPDSATSRGGAVTGFTVNPPLPSGLSLDTATGLISGTPTSASALASYTITAGGPGGTGIVKVAISVQVPPPFAPVLLAPAQNAAGAAISTILRWNSSAGASAYRIQLATDSNFAGLVLNDSAVSDTLRALGPLANGTVYYWRVNARNAGGVSAYSARRTFTTIVAAPAAPLLSSPGDKVAARPLSDTLKWLAAAGAAAYRVQLSKDSAFAVLVLDDSTLTATARVLTGLSNNTVYYWRVNARNAGGISAYSAKRSFTTVGIVAVLPQAFSLERRASNGILRFSLPRKSRVTLSLYDSKGALVLRLSDEVREAGYYMIPLPAKYARSHYLLDFRAGKIHEVLRL